MVECIFTIDYEIYGDGQGSLKELVYDPADRLRAIFLKSNARFVLFVEIAELEMIADKRTDSGIDSVKQQIRKLHDEGFELGLHLHPQWYKGRYEKGRWLLDYSEYNLCTLPRERIAQIVDRSTSYFRDVLEAPDFAFLSFRAGNWLFQPTEALGGVLAQRGIKIDSSVFKGGVQRDHKLDYREALKNSFYWTFQSEVNKPAPDGNLIEIPIYTEMVPFWKMLTAKRIQLQRKGVSTGKKNGQKLNRVLDYLRPWYPLKLDFCRMTLDELTRMMDAVIREDQKDPTPFRPIVAIGHTKDLVDFETVESFLSYLEKKRIRVSTFEEVYPKCS